MEHKPTNWDTAGENGNAEVYRTRIGDCLLEVRKASAQSYFWAVSYAYEDGMAKSADEAKAAATQSASSLARLMRLRPMSR